MNVKIQSVKFDADKRLVDFIQAKMDKMDRFVERAIGAQVTLRIDKDDEQGNKVAIVKIDVAGDELLAERRCKTFEEAIDLCLDAIKKQIDKYKEKRRYTERECRSPRRGTAFFVRIPFGRYPVIAGVHVLSIDT